MPWHLPSAGCQHPRYWPCRINGTLSSTRFNDLSHLSVEIWKKINFITARVNNIPVGTRCQSSFRLATASINHMEIIDYVIWISTVSGSCYDWGNPWLHIRSWCAWLRRNSLRYCWHRHVTLNLSNWCCDSFIMTVFNVHHRALSPWEDEPTHNKKSTGCRPPERTLSDVYNRYVRCIIYFH